MSEEEVKDLRARINYGLALSEWNMLKQKAIRNEKVVTKSRGKVCEVSARYLMKKLYGNSKMFPMPAPVENIITKRQTTRADWE